MDPDTAATSPETHYHIRWVSSGALDWERHDTRAHAEEAAKRLSRANEGYVVEQFDKACIRCQTLDRSGGRAVRTL